MDKSILPGKMALYVSRVHSFRSAEKELSCQRFFCEGRKRKWGDPSDCDAGLTSVEGERGGRSVGWKEYWTTVQSWPVGSPRARGAHWKSLGSYQNASAYRCPLCSVTSQEQPWQQIQKDSGWALTQLRSLQQESRAACFNGCHIVTGRLLT